MAFKTNRVQRAQYKRTVGCAMPQHYSSAPNVNSSSTAVKTTWSKTRRFTSWDARLSRPQMCLMCRAYWTSPFCLRLRVLFGATQLLLTRVLRGSLYSSSVVSIRGESLGIQGICSKMISSTPARTPDKRLMSQQVRWCPSIPRASKSYQKVKSPWKFTWNTEKIMTRYKTWRQRLTSYFP